MFAAKTLPSNARLINNRAIAFVDERCQTTGLTYRRWIDLDSRQWFGPSASARAMLMGFIERVRAERWNPNGVERPVNLDADLAVIKRHLGTDVAASVEARYVTQAMPAGLFALGQVLITPNVKATLRVTDEDVFAFLALHVAGDFGLCGQIKTELSDDERFCPALLSRAGFNTAVIEAGAGLVESRYPLVESRAMNRGPGEELRILTLLGEPEERYRKTLVFSTRDPSF